jgi:hypothetical protein
MNFRRSGSTPFRDCIKNSKENVSDENIAIKKAEENYIFSIFSLMFVECIKWLFLGRRLIKQKKKTARHKFQLCPLRMRVHSLNIASTANIVDLQIMSCIKHRSF